MYMLYRVKLYCININISLIIVNIYENAFELNVASYQVRQDMSKAHKLKGQIYFYPHIWL